jgi:hypothetical protein
MCSVCGEVKDEEIPATGNHNYEGGDCQHHSVCTVCGAEGPMGTHHFITVHVDEVTHEEWVQDPVIQIVGGNFPNNNPNNNPASAPSGHWETVVDQAAYDEEVCECCWGNRGDLENGN